MNLFYSQNQHQDLNQIKKNWIISNRTVPEFFRWGCPHPLPLKIWVHPQSQENGLYGKPRSSRTQQNRMGSSQQRNPSLINDTNGRSWECQDVLISSFIPRIYNTDCTKPAFPILSLSKISIPLSRTKGKSIVLSCAAGSSCITYFIPGMIDSALIGDPHDTTKSKSPCNGCIKEILI